MRQHEGWGQSFWVRRFSSSMHQAQIELQQSHKTKRSTFDSGFSMLEVIVVMAIVGIIAAIAAPSWVSFSTTWKLNAAQDEVYQALRQAQAEAKRRGIGWQVSFQNVDGQAQYASHPVTTAPFLAAWSTLPESVQLDPDRTTVRLDNGVYEVQFNHKGHVNGQLGRVSLMGNESVPTRRSVLASTLIGALRKAKN